MPVLLRWVMTSRRDFRLRLVGSALFVFATCAAAAAAPQHAETVQLIVPQGRALHVTVSERIRIRRIGQPVDGRMAQSLFAYDRVVVPAGASVRGHIARLAAPSTWQRLRAYWSGDFSPHRQVILEFDSVQLENGLTLRLDSVSSASFAHPSSETVPSLSEEHETRARFDVRQWPRRMFGAARQRARDAVALVRAPGKLHRLKTAAVNELPYHPQYLDKGTLYVAPLATALQFGTVAAVALAPPDTRPQPSTVIKASLISEIGSAKSRRGSRVDATLTEPVFSQTHALVLPEGTELSGEVTLARPARRFHRNGQLRFLIERVKAPGRPEDALLASLHDVQSSVEDHVALDEEGGVTITNPKSRFVAPVLATLALRRGLHHDDDDDAAGGVTAQPRRAHSSFIGSLIGFRLAGVILGRASQPVGVALTAMGVARTVYTNILGRGKDVLFPADTPIQLQLAPGPDR